MSVTPCLLLQHPVQVFGKIRKGEGQKMSAK